MKKSKFIYKIAIGTNSKYKINAIEKVLHELDMDFTSYSGFADSEVSAQPCKKEETKNGSINRAKNILNSFPDCDFGIGVEFGYEKINETYHMVCWASIATSNSKIFSEQSSTLELPKTLYDSLSRNEDVSDNLHKILNKLEKSESSRVFQEFLEKRIFIYQSVTTVLLRFIFSEDFY